MTTITSELRELLSLHEAGAITREQFEEHRDLLLAQWRSSTQPPGPGFAGGPSSVGAYHLIGTIGDGGSCLLEFGLIPEQIWIVLDHGPAP